MRRLLAACLVLAGCRHHAAPQGKPLRVLFIGNSYTQVNDLPSLVAGLAGAIDRRFEPTQDTPGGLTLQQHWLSTATQNALARQPWDWVVLQEQSQAPSFPGWQVRRDMYPAVRQFDRAIRDRGAHPLLYLTWGHRAGDTANWKGDTYDAMQARLDDGYETIARELAMPVAPVGRAWQRAHQLRPTLALWQPDDSHPTIAGSYLAACVFFQVFYARPSLGNAFRADLDADTARFLQTVASDVTSGYRP